MNSLENTRRERKKFLVLILCLLTCLAENINNSLPTPFFPTEATTHGVSQTTVGVIVATFNVFVTISAISMLLVASPTKMKTWFCVGAITSGATCVVFGELPQAPPGTTFAVLCILTRAIMGCGATAIWGSGAPIMLPLFPQWQGRVMSLVEFTGGLGLMLGPPIGSLLYSLGGYSLPFRVVGALEVFLAAICLLAFPSSNTATSDSSMNLTIKSENQSSFALKFIGNPGIWICSLPLLVNTAFIGFTMTALSPFLLTEFGIKQETAGLYFIPYSLVNTIGTICMGGLVDKGYGGLLYCIGAIGTTVSCLALSLPIYVPYFHNLYFLETCFVLSGLSFSAILTPVLLLFVTVGRKNEIASTNQLQVFAASWTTSTIASGLIYGQALIGGLFFQQFRFYNSCVLQAVICCIVTFMVMQYMMRNDLIRAKKNSKNSALNPLLNVKIGPNEDKNSLSFSILGFFEVPQIPRINVTMQTMS